MSEQDFGDGAGSEDQNSLIKSLRADLKAASSKAQLYDQAREQAAENVLTDLGFPGLKTLYVEKSKDFPTPQSATEFLASLGLEAKAPGAEAPVEPVEPESDKAQEIADVSNLGAQAAAAASKTPIDRAKDLTAKIESAQNPQELEAIMAAAGLRMTS